MSKKYRLSFCNIMNRAPKFFIYTYIFVHLLCPLIFYFLCSSGKPPQESRRVRAPAFTFGHKLEPPGLISKAGPGPATYNTEGMTAKGTCTLKLQCTLSFIT